MNLGIVASAHVSSAGVVPVRTAQVTVASATSTNLSFTEPSALGSTYLLVAVAGSSNSSLMSAAGWTAVHGTSNTSRQTRIWAKQGDGSTNSITVTSSAGTAKSIQLFAFAGYSSTTPIATGGTTHTGTPVTLSTTTTPAGNGVWIGVLYTAGAATISGESWTNGVQNVMSPAPSPTTICGYLHYTGSVSSTVLTWTSGGSSGNWAAAILPLI